jgi:MFS-type transporter involved in bile tolerance (Atg22 family)
MQFLFGPIIGALSDRFGRRPILLMSLAVMSADYLLMALAPTIWLLLRAGGRRDHGGDPFDRHRLYRRHHPAGPARTRALA